MRIAVVADIHGNVRALRAVMDDIKQVAPDSVVNLGDCVSGPLWPRETAELLIRFDWPTVRGNHDRWGGSFFTRDLGIAFYSPYPFGFWLSTIAFAGYVAAVGARHLVERRG